MLLRYLERVHHGTVLTSSFLLVYLGAIYYQEHTGKAGVAILVTTVALAAYLLVGHLVHEAHTLRPSHRRSVKPAGSES